MVERMQVRWAVALLAFGGLLLVAVVLSVMVW